MKRENVDQYTVVRIFETEDHSVENIHKQLDVYLNEIKDYAKIRDCNTFQISKVDIEVIDSVRKNINTECAAYVPTVESFKEIKKSYKFTISVNILVEIDDETGFKTYK